MQISIKISGVSELIKDYSLFQKEFDNLTEPIQKSMSSYLNVIHTNFKTGGKVFSSGWVPLAPATIKDKEKEMRAGSAISLKPLIRTGKMMSSFNSLARPKNGEIYNEMEYAKLHQEGGFAIYHKKTVKVPQRILADVDNTREEMVSNTFEGWLHKLMLRYKL